MREGKGKGKGKGEGRGEGEGSGEGKGNLTSNDATLKARGRAVNAFQPLTPRKDSPDPRSTTSTKRLRTRRGHRRSRFWLAVAMSHPLDFCREWETYYIESHRYKAQVQNGEKHERFFTWGGREELLVKPHLIPSGDYDGHGLYPVVAKLQKAAHFARHHVATASE